jgi:hypothetical protein
MQGAKLLHHWATRIKNIVAHRLYKASSIGRNDVCTHGGSFVCERQFQRIFGMSCFFALFGLLERMLLHSNLLAREAYFHGK